MTGAVATSSPGPAGPRRIQTQVEETVLEYGAELPRPMLRIWAAGVVRNPWVGKPVDAVLAGDAAEIAPPLARALSRRVVAAAGGAGSIEAFGKAALVGAGGELEHGAALLHTPHFANLVRESLEGTTVIPFADGRVQAGTAIAVPLGRKVDGRTRDWFQSVSVHLSDAPAAEEIVLVVAASTGPRPFARSGDRSTDPVLNRDDMRSRQP